MDVLQLRPQFTVYVVDRDGLAAKSLNDTVLALGYSKVRFFPTYESAMVQVNEDPPHILLIGYSAHEAGVENFLGELKDFSPETLTVLICPARDTLACLQIVGRHLAFDMCVRPFVSTLDLVQKMDRAAAQLYYQFESEQLRDVYQDHAPQGSVQTPDQARAPRAAPLGAVTQPAAPSSEVAWLTLGPLLRRLADTKDIESNLQIMTDGVAAQFSSSPVIYFKYMPTINSLLFSHAAHLPTEKFRSVGVDLNSLSSTDLEKAWLEPNGIVPLQIFLKEIFNRTEFVTWTHVNDGAVVGLVVVLTEPSQIEMQVLEGMKQLLNLSYSRNLSLKARHSLEIYDQVTGLYSRKFLMRAIEDEVSRSRRILMPVAMLRIDIDPLPDARGAESALRILAGVFKKTTRTNDIVARTGASEFAIVMPHTSQAGASLKAERLRRAVESFGSTGGLGVTISCGVAEYPSLSSDTESLLRAADNAAFEAKKAGGNQICVAQVPPSFVVDFVPLQVPYTPRRTGET